MARYRVVPINGIPKTGKGAIMSAESIILNGTLRLTATVFNPKTAEISVRGDVVYQNSTYLDLPIVRLVVTNIDGDVYVDDDFATVIPYLKPVAAFRTYLIQALPRLQHSMGEWFVGGILNEGIMAYVRELTTFSTVRSLVSQAKTAANSLDAKKPGAEKMARAVLVALGRTPSMDNEFLVVTR